MSAGMVPSLRGTLVTVTEPTSTPPRATGDPAAASGNLPPARATLPATALETTQDRPWPVRHLSPKIRDYVAKMSPVWVEGQVLNMRRWKHLVFLTLRDTDENMSIKATVPAAQVDKLGGLADGARVVVHAQPSWWMRSGELQLEGDQVAMVGVGDLLARIEALKNALAKEGLFAAERKVPLPFVPRLVGLVCAAKSDAEHDVIENAGRRWPGVAFEVRHVTVQGPRCVPEVSAAIRELDAHAEVDVIVVARGGGSFEDLLPFSDESLVRVAAACVTPLVSAIGHEKDTPLLDFVADLRASTPTDAGKRIVPDAVAELAMVAAWREALGTALGRLVERRGEQLTAMRERSGRGLVGVLERADAATRELVATLRALSPQATLDRGFAVVQDSAGAVVRDAAAVNDGDALRLRLARGELAARASKP